jgi:hypothetical protein
MHSLQSEVRSQHMQLRQAYYMIYRLSSSLNVIQAVRDVKGATRQQRIFCFRQLEPFNQWTIHT